MNWAFVGASTIVGQRLARAILAKDPCMDRRSVSSGNDRAVWFARTYRIAQSGPHMSASADFVVHSVCISSTNEKPHVRVMAAIEAGKHGLCEKPQATSITDAQSTVQAERAGVELGANHNLRRAGCLCAVLARGELSQEPADEIDLVSIQGTKRVECDRSRLYENLAHNFCAARTRTAFGGDRKKPLQIAFASRDAALAGQRQTVRYGDEG